MFIRVTQQKDIETLFDIRTSVIENHQSREEIAELGITPDSVADMLQTDCNAWIAELDSHRLLRRKTTETARTVGQSIGFSIANKTEKTVLGVFVLPSFEGRGIGRILIQAAEDWLWSNDIKEIWLVTGNNSKLRAYGFYLHLGWIPIGVESDGAFKGEMKFVKRWKEKR